LARHAQPRHDATDRATAPGKDFLRTRLTMRSRRDQNALPPPVPSVNVFGRPRREKEEIHSVVTTVEKFLASAQPAATPAAALQLHGPLPMTAVGEAPWQRRTNVWREVTSLAPVKPGIV